MPQTIKVATVQMDANPASVTERLERAEKIITHAADKGAQLVVLPELFNIGYAYSDANFTLAEPINGTTSSWMKAVASRVNIHLAGSLLLLEQGEIYNALLLFSPAGQAWRYDKNYPWAWERGYFRERRGMTIAHTELGDLGMMICWDIGHLKLWKQYAGQVDMMVIASCPPDGSNAAYQFSDGSQLNFHNLGPVMDSQKDSGRQVFSDMVQQQAGWLGVPVVNSGANGSIRTEIPKAKSLMMSFLLLAPRLIKQIVNGNQMQMLSDMISSCKIVDAQGKLLAERTPGEGEGYVMMEVQLPRQKSMPKESQPKSPLNPLAYLHSDILIPSMMKSVYRKGKKQLKTAKSD